MEIKIKIIGLLGLSFLAWLTVVLQYGSKEGKQKYTTEGMTKPLTIILTIFAMPFGVCIYPFLWVKNKLWPTPNN